MAPPSAVLAMGLLASPHRRLRWQVDSGKAASGAMLKTLAKFYKLLCAATKLVRTCLRHDVPHEQACLNVGVCFCLH